MRPYTIPLTKQNTLTIDLEHLIAVQGPFFDRFGVWCNLYFLYRDEPVKVFREYMRSEEDNNDHGYGLRRKDGTIRMFEDLSDCSDTLAYQNFKQVVMAPLDAAWIG